MTTTAPLALPPQLAPALRGRVFDLLAECELVSSVPEPPRRRRRTSQPPRCVVCFQSGRLGGHHDEAGEVEWVHRSCHRRLHRRGKPTHRSARLAAMLSRSSACI
jgi:hypothetical protein